MVVACNMGEVADGALLLVSSLPANAPASRPARTLLRCRPWPTDESRCCGRRQGQGRAKPTATDKAVGRRTQPAAVCRLRLPRTL